jgi:hypothetical protein
LRFNELSAPKAPSWQGKYQALSKGKDLFILEHEAASTQHQLNALNVTSVGSHEKDRTLLLLVCCCGEGLGIALKFGKIRESVPDPDRWRDLGCGSVICLPTMHKALSSTSSTSKDKRYRI